jgi:hypothetical protein
MTKSKLEPRRICLTTWLKPEQVSGLLKKLGHEVRRITFNESVYDGKNAAQATYF